MYKSLVWYRSEARALERPNLINLTENQAGSEVCLWDSGPTGPNRQTNSTDFIFHPQRSRNTSWLIFVLVSVMWLCCINLHLHVPWYWTTYIHAAILPRLLTLILQVQTSSWRSRLLLALRSLSYWIKRKALNIHVRLTQTSFRQDHLYRRSLHWAARWLNSSFRTTGPDSSEICSGAAELKALAHQLDHMEAVNLVWDQVVMCWSVRLKFQVNCSFNNLCFTHRAGYLKSLPSFMLIAFCLLVPATRCFR